MDFFTTVWDQMDVNPIFKQCIEIIINKLIKSESINEYEFPSSFTANERQYVANYCSQMGLKTKSRSKGSNRFITAYKNSSTIISMDSSYDLSDFTQNTIKSLLQRFPVSEKERKDATHSGHSFDRLASGHSHQNSFESNRELNCTTGRLSNIIPQIPCPPPFASGRVDDMVVFRKSLPIWQKRNELMEMIASNRIVCISGATGCGKTTQIPQYILEYCNLMKKACRLICSEPSSLSAHSLAERVSNERMEVIGQTIGYQIRLESKVSPRTLLTFCTNGVLLRTLMGGENPLQSVTHLIVDEIQESDRFSEFLILILKELIGKYRNFKLILMSSNPQTVENYSRYFGSCPTLEICCPTIGRQFYFLEDILKMTSYMSDSMKRYKESIEVKETQKQILSEWFDEINVSKFVNKFNDFSFASGDIGLNMGFESSFSASNTFGSNRLMLCESDIVERELDVKIKIELDSYLKNAWTQGTNEAFENLLSFIIANQISVDYQHSVSGVTALIAGASHNRISCVESLLSVGANIDLCTPNDWNAIQWAQHFGHKELVELLETYCKCVGRQTISEELNYIQNEGMEQLLRPENKQILDIYYHSLIDSNLVELDIELICHLIDYIIINCEKLCPQQKNGSILVFLNGYEEIIKLRERILSDSKRFDADKYVLFTLYSQMPNSDLKRVFRRMPSEVRKIILSTNIAETCITIDDVVFVIDSGKIRERVYDKSSGFSYNCCNWISKTNAIQRRNGGNVSKSGICFHLYDKTRFNRLDNFQTPEMNKMSIFELCLQSKLLAPNHSISDFLSKAVNPPSIESIRKSIQLLKTIDALESSEQLTELGLHLLDLPIEPNLGKMVLYSVVLKCLDPVLTIVCSLSYRNPLVVPQSQASLKRSAFVSRKRFSAKTFSDHIILLRAFQNWQKAKHEVCEKKFCDHNFISSAAMEMIVNMRAKLLGQLRASGFVRARGAGDIRDLNTNSENWAVVKAALCAGGYPYIMRIDREKNRLITRNEGNVRFHPNSVLNTCSLDPKESIDKSRTQFLSTLRTDWLIFNSMTKINKTCYVECCTLITPITVALFAGNIQTTMDSYLENVCKQYGAQFGDLNSDSESEDQIHRDRHVFKIDDWLQFKVDSSIASLTLQLRQKFNSLVLRRMCFPSKPMTPSDDIIIKTIVEVLSSEEQSLGLQQPVGIGQRPRPMSTDFCPPVSNIPLNSPMNKSSLQTGRQPRVSPQTQHSIRSQFQSRNVFQ